MLTLINGLPENVLGVSAEGEVSGSDYETVFIPAVENKLKVRSKIRLLYHLSSHFDGFDLTAAIDDAKTGMKNLASWERIALVSDHLSINLIAKFFGCLMSCEVQVFKNTDLQKAKQWIVQ